MDQRPLFRAIHFHFFGRGPTRPFKDDGLGVRRQAVMLRTIQRRESLQFVQRVLFGKDLGVGFDRDRRVENARHARRC